MATLQDIGNLRRLFSDIVRGFSVGKYNNQTVYIKHFSVFDQVELDDYSKTAFEHAKRSGAKTSDEIVAQLRAKGLWTDNDEIFLAQKKSIIEQMEKTLAKLDLIAAINDVKKSINEAKQEYNKKLRDKESLIGMTCEKFAANRTNSYYIYKSFCKDKSLQEPLFSEEEFEETDDDTIGDLIRSYNNAVSGLNTENVKKIALCAFFQNNFYLAESAYEYWGKRLIDLTIHQSELSSFGRYYHSLLKNHSDIPDEVKTDPEKLVQFIEHGKNMDDMLKGTGPISRVGMTKEDLATKGLKFDDTLAIEARKAQKEGRKLTALDIARIEGITNEVEVKGQQIRTVR